MSHDVSSGHPRSIKMMTLSSRKRCLPLTIVTCLSLNYCHALSPSSSLTESVLSRRAYFYTNAAIVATTYAATGVSVSSAFGGGGAETFSTAAYDKQEYTNSIVASRDTNISPKEVYDTLQKLKVTSTSGKSTGNQMKRALDVGAGAGVSTQVLYEMGYTTIDALDWSRGAWDANVISCPPSVTFYELDDERFLRTEWDKKNGRAKYDVIAFNFAVNRNKAEYFATQLLAEDGILLAPINTQTDYWFKQVYTLMDHSGTILWTANDVGAWSVLFQPDVTQDTCQGIWCSSYNGFKKLK